MKQGGTLLAAIVGDLSVNDGVPTTIFCPEISTTKQSLVVSTRTRRKNTAEPG